MASRTENAFEVLSRDEAAPEVEKPAVQVTQEDVEKGTARAEAKGAVLAPTGSPSPPAAVRIGGGVWGGEKPAHVGFWVATHLCRPRFSAAASSSSRSRSFPTLMAHIPLPLCAACSWRMPRQPPAAQVGRSPCKLHRRADCCLACIPCPAHTDQPACVLTCSLDSVADTSNCCLTTVNFTLTHIT